MKATKTTCAAAAVCALAGVTSVNATVDVVFNQITGHPKAVVPSGAGLAPGTEFKVQTTTGFDRPFASPDGTKIFFTGLANLTISEDECYILMDSSGAATVVREGTTVGSPTAETLGGGDQRMGVNNAGQFAIGIRMGGTAAVDKCIVGWDGTQFNLIAREGSPVPGVAGENFGDGSNSAQVLADGTVAFCAIATAGGLPANEDDFCFVGNTIQVQAGDAIETSVWNTFNVSNFYVTGDGAHWMLIGDDATTNNRILAYDGMVMVREAVPLIGSTYTSNVATNFGPFEALLADDGSWMLRGHNADGQDWVVRNGTVIAEKGGQITPGNKEVWDDTTFADLFFFIASDAEGNHVVGGLTSAADIAANAVLVYNGETVIAREGDMIDLNGNGLDDDDAFISIFNNDDGVLTSDGRLIFFANCVDGLGVSIGQMVLSVDVPVDVPCPADVAPSGGDQMVNVDDLLAVINSWGPCPGCPADIDGNDVVNVDDLLAVINGWGPCDG